MTNSFSFGAGQVPANDIVMHSGTPHELRITKDGITYRGQTLEDVGAVHKALNEVLNGRPLPPLERAAAPTDAVSYNASKVREGMRKAIAEHDASQRAAAPVSGGERARIEDDATFAALLEEYDDAVGLSQVACARGAMMSYINQKIRAAVAAAIDVLPALRG